MFGRTIRPVRNSAPSSPPPKESAPMTRRRKRPCPTLLLPSKKPSNPLQSSTKAKILTHTPTLASSSAVTLPPAPTPAPSSTPPSQSAPMTRSRKRACHPLVLPSKKPPNPVQSSTAAKILTQAPTLTSSSAITLPPAPSSAITSPPAPSSAITSPPAPSSAITSPPAPFTAITSPPAPTSAPSSTITSPPAPSSAITSPPAPTPAPYSTITSPPAPFTAITSPPAPTPAPSSTITSPPAPSSAITSPPAPTPAPSSAITSPPAPFTAITSPPAPFTAITSPPAPTPAPSSTITSPPAPSSAITSPPAPTPAIRPTEEIASTSGPNNISTPHSPTLCSNACPSEILFKEVEAILPLGFGHRKKRYSVTVEELKRRVGPPEGMSLASCVAYLRMDKNKKASLKTELDNVGVCPRPVTTLTSMCSKLTEGEVVDLSQSLSHLVATQVPFSKVKLLEERDTDVALGHLALFKEMIKTASEGIKAEAGMFNLATHGLGFSLLHIFENLFTECADAQIAALKAT
ncbi:uncharacterized protein LOC125801397 isoform X2 [Astyanax mexicanus]|uniref:uncharacterized protein LOC125801397 isoform X2 n=1 Tax=Astyanax mexicanus TaxID=7994 RepID=UPI0020CB0169|nr:uncharacterized protein LOC125801397 isoform X2 [Astyanax mexicanus]